MNQRVNQIITKLQEQYQDIDTILLFGSATKDSWTPPSDIDVFLIDPSISESREDLVIDGVTVELQKDNFKNLMSDVEKERGNLLHRNLATMLATATTIKTNSEEDLTKLQSLASSVLESKTTYTDEDVKMWRYSIQDYLDKAQKDLSRDDAVAFYLDAHYVIQNALELSLATHGAYLPQPKHLKSLLATTDENLLNILEEYTSAPDLSAKFSALTKLQ